MDVPLGACWWCLNEDKDMCGQCSGCMRWREALLAVDPAGRLDIRVLATQSLKTV
jgi:7-cyano-7-deazaguanine synthase in queuosine biosynthesis